MRTLRSRVLASTTIANRLLVLVGLTCNFTGAGSWAAQPPDNSSAEHATSAPAEAEAGEVRTMTIRVLDESGVPLKGATVNTSVWELGNAKRRFPNAVDVTDVDGKAEFEIPTALEILRIWVRSSNHVSMAAGYETGQHEQGRLIPSQLDFVLSKGSKLTGKVVNENGLPIAGVLVNIQANAVPPLNKPVSVTIPQMSVGGGWTEDGKPLMTDKDGNWEINTAPSKTPTEDYEFTLQFLHDDYIPDQHHGDSQREQGITTSMLRKGNAKVVLKRGFRVTGAILDPNGQPITRGLVVWHDSPYFSHFHFGIQETQLDESGEFRTKGLRPGDHPITVIAPGFMPERRVVKVSESMEKLRFDLKHGNRIAIRVVDCHGYPIPGAHVQLEKWRGTQALYNDSHPNVLHSGIPASADDEGLYVWDWAPNDAVTYSICAPVGTNFSTEVVSLVPREAEHIVTLIDQLRVRGKVTDATTGSSITEFPVPVIVFEPQFLSTDYDRECLCRDGKYELDDFPLSSDGRQYQIRIEADGYRTVLSERIIQHADGQVTLDFSLEPASALKGEVVSPSGKPVSGASVLMGTPTVVPRVHNNSLDSDGRQIETDDEGRFEIASSFEPARLRVIHETGFAEVLRRADEPPGKIELQPWAKVYGSLRQNGNPVLNETVYFRPILEGGLGDPRFQDSYTATTDGRGRFKFDRLPPIAGHVNAQLSPWQDSPLTSSQSVPLDLKPGDAQTISLGGNGTSVTGKVLAMGRGKTELNKNWSLNYLIRRDTGITSPAGFPALSFDPNGPLQSTWSLDENFQAWVATRNHHFVKLSPEGDLIISGVPVGEYDLLLQLYEQPAGCLVETVGQRVVPIVITEADMKSGKKDLGRIDVECRVGPRVGQNMQAFKFIDAIGRERTVFELKGQYILMHVWASSCIPCVETMPRIQSTIQKAGKKKITFVGLNIDEESNRAKGLVARNKWEWSQSYLGGQSEMVKQLAISSVPTYFLISPDGLLATSASDWTVMEEAIEAIPDTAP